MKRIAALLAALCTLWAGCARAEQPARRQQARDIFIAVGHDCPQTAADALTALCDGAAKLSQDEIRGALQYWADPFASDAQLVFAMTDALAASDPALAALDAPYLFPTVESGDEAMNAQTILAMLSDTAGDAGGYEAVSSFYCGRTFLLTGDGRLQEWMRADDTQMIAQFTKSLADGRVTVAPLDLTAAPEEDTLYTAGTDALAALPDGSLGPYVLADMPYRCRFGVLFMRRGLREELGAARYAAVLEAAASAKPRCMTAYQETDARVVAGAPQVISPSVKLCRSLRGSAEEAQGTAQSSDLYRELSNYTD